jgi:hypothetical protein
MTRVHNSVVYGEKPLPGQQRFNDSGFHSGMSIEQSPSQCLSRIPDPDIYPPRIPDPTTAPREERKIFFVLAFFVATYIIKM